MPKIATGTEFRSAFACEEEERGIIHVFPGKVGDIFNIASEVKSLITNKNILRNGNYKYIKEGTLDKGMNEIQQKPQGEALARSTCGLKTYEEWEVNYKRRKVIPFAKYRDGGGSPTLFKKPGKRKRAPLDDNKTAPMPKQYLKQKC